MPKSNSLKSPSSGTENSLSEMGEKIKNYVRAGYPGLYLVSHEEQRVDAEMIEVAKSLKYGLYFWSVVSGLIDAQKSQLIKSAQDPLEALIGVTELNEKSIVLLKDFHLY